MPFITRRWGDAFVFCRGMHCIVSNWPGSCYLATLHSKVSFLTHKKFFFHLRSKANMQILTRGNKGESFDWNGKRSVFPFSFVLACALLVGGCYMGSIQGFYNGVGKSIRKRDTKDRGAQEVSYMRAAKHNGKWVMLASQKQIMSSTLQWGV
jgi:hypothetical protein